MAAIMPLLLRRAFFVAGAEDGGGACIPFAVDGSRPCLRARGDPGGWPMLSS